MSKPGWPWESSHSLKHFAENLFNVALILYSRMTKDHKMRQRSFVDRFCQTFMDNLIKYPIVE